jgi:geranyl-CoA carboxylase alpha subunit
MSWDTILIANRGEIACRIIRAARSLGLRSVAVYSETDRQAPHVQLADDAVYLGPAEASQSYLNLDKIINAARQSGAGAIHPGYGFFSENPALPERCKAEGITWIGPSAEAIKLMGDKRAARIAVAQRDVPCVPGYDGDDQSDERLITEAERIGFPLMVKASMGGGGKGMRLVHSLDEVSDSLQAARREAAAAFGNGSLILERAIINPKHIEVQVFADQYGEVVHLGERECSLQRRHQKVIEEAPSPALTPSLRSAMGEAAVEVARSVQYLGAGTVEFLLDMSGSFYFLEMNTRIQVEHPVTEEVYRVDLVAWQIQVSRGEPLPYTQAELNARLSGHAIEVRIYAEDPAQNFMPQAGPILRWLPPSGLGIRVDAGIGVEVSSSYDPMLAKVIAHGPTRDIARLRLLRALEQLVLFGPNHNLAFLKRLLRSTDFIDGTAHTRTIDDDLKPDTRPTPPSWMQGLAAVALSAPHSSYTDSPQPLVDGWGSALRSTWPVFVSLDLEGFQRPELQTDETISSPNDTPPSVDEYRQVWQITQRSRTQFSAELKQDPLQIASVASETPTIYHFEDLSWNDDATVLSFTMDGMILRQNAHIERPKGQPHQLSLQSPEGHQLRFVDHTYVIAPPKEAEGGDNRVRAPMSGKVIAVCCELGQAVRQGDTLLILEAMKLEHQIVAPINGIISELCAAEGDQVSAKQQLIELHIDEHTSTIPNN